MQRIKKFFSLFGQTFQLFNQYNGLKLSAALSYYTVFSLAPLLVVIISVAGVFFGRKAVQGKVYDQISGLVGSDTALQIQQIMQNVQKSHHGIIGGIIGIVVLLITASGVFSEIQDSINYMWSIKNDGKKKFLQIITQKLLSFSLLGGMTFILMVSLIANSVIDVLSDRLKTFLASYTFYLFYAVNILLILSVITCLFAMIFKVLPNTTLSWKNAFTGALFTAVFFLIGKLLIGLYLGNSQIGQTYGTTASVVIIMLWVYYSSIILYFGAAFTEVYVTSTGKKITAKHPGNPDTQKL